jgi:hypothetical protein
VRARVSALKHEFIREKHTRGCLRTTKYFSLTHQQGKTRYKQPTRQTHTTKSSDSYRTTAFQATALLRDRMFQGGTGGSHYTRKRKHRRRRGKNSRGSPLRVGDMHLKKKSVERHAGRGRRTSHARAKHTAERTTAPTRNPLEQFEVTALHPTLLPLANLAFHT